MSALLNHWNLVTRPFEATWDVRFFFRSQSHAEALDRLTYVVQEGGMNLALLTGEVGVGKTITRSFLQQSLQATHYKCLTLENSGFSMNDLLGALLRRLTPLDSQVPQERLARFEFLQQRLEAEAESGRQVVLFLDEAQDLSLDTLKELRWLTNLNGSGRSLITVILIGQPQLGAMVQQVPAIDQRIGLRYHLSALRENELGAYLAHRLHAAGHPNGLLFDASAVSVMYELTRGLPRLVNRLAKLSLEFAWAQDVTQVSAHHVSSVARDIAAHQAAVGLAA